MPARAKPPRLYFRSGRRDATGAHQGTWVILDRGRHIATGCLQGEIEDAGRALANYIAAKHDPRQGPRRLAEIAVSDVLSVYADAAVAEVTDRKKLVARLGRLNDFFGRMSLAEINGATCRAYTAERDSRAGARRELEDLRAAINYHADEGLHREIVKVTLPIKARARTRWLTRSEAAALIWICWRYRELQKGRPTKKQPLRHLARFMLIALYTGTRAGAVASASPRPLAGRSWVDLDSGVFHRLAIGARETNKRQPPVRLPGRLLAHLRRWARLDPGMQWFVAWHGRPVKSVKTGFATALRLANLEGEGISPHTFRHTAATWLMQQGVSTFKAAGFLGMSEETLRRVYGHHHPDYQADEADALGYGRLRPQVIARRMRDGEARNPPEALAEALADEEEAMSEMAESFGGPGRTRTCNQIVMSDRL